MAELPRGQTEFRAVSIQTAGKKTVFVSVCLCSVFIETRIPIMVNKMTKMIQTTKTKRGVDSSYISVVFPDRCLPGNRDLLMLAINCFTPSQGNLPL